MIRMPIDSTDMLELLACPKCKGRLTRKTDALQCDACLLSYPIREGIPVLLLDEAMPVDAASKPRD
jgi:uncharacterized protein YbaR (Trm112 family)